MSDNPLTSQPVIPKEAAAVVLLRNPPDPQVFWVKRGPAVRFMAGYHAFPGGQIDEDDRRIDVLNSTDANQSRLMACAAREILEETGVLIARGSERLSADVLSDLRDEIISGRTDFSEVLRREHLQLDRELFDIAPRWVTPAHMPRRYDTQFLIAWLPQGQETHVIPGELAEGQWLRPSEALEQWRNGESLIATPILDIIRALADGVDGSAERLHRVPQSHRDEHQRIELCEGFFICSLRSPTIPPATHTNCYLVGGDDLVVIDPGSPYEDEQAKLDDLIDLLRAEGRRLREILITHLHPDHIGGVEHLRRKYNIPVACHRLTADAISKDIVVDRLIEDGEIIELPGQAVRQLTALWTPGHAKGHLCFYEPRTGTVLTGDLVVGFGTVVIAPPEGNLRHYLESLERLLALPRLTSLMPGHGPVVANARAKIEEYIFHRAERDQQILERVSQGPQTVSDLVASIYADLPDSLRPLAAATVEAHLEKLEEDNQVRRTGDKIVRA